MECVTLFNLLTAPSKANIDRLIECCKSTSLPSFLIRYRAKNFNWQYLILTFKTFSYV